MNFYKLYDCYYIFEQWIKFANLFYQQKVYAHAEEKPKWAKVTVQIFNTEKRFQIAPNFRASCVCACTCVENFNLKLLMSYTEEKGNIMRIFPPTFEIKILERKGQC